jgi:hypothetical protein
VWQKYYERRLATTEAAMAIEPLPVDLAATQQWATLCVRLAEVGRTVKVNDRWIAAVAAANRLAVLTQGDDFDAIEAVGGPPVIRV